MGTRLSGVYVIRNEINNKVYVGSAVDLRDRWRRHKKGLQKGSHENGYLQHAWNKYGERSFEFSVIEYLSPEELIRVEQFWIDHFDASNRTFGYNIRPTAGSPLGVKHSEETKRKMTLARLGKKQSPEHTANIRKSKQTISDETRRKQSNALKGRRLSDEHCKKISQCRTGSRASEETKRKMKESAKRRPPVSEETRRKRSESLKARWLEKRQCETVPPS